MVCFFHFTNFVHEDVSILPEGDIIANIGIHGVQGVFVFFVITGFVIPLSLYRSHYKIENISRFLKKRWIRIEIPYIASIFATLLIWYIFDLFAAGESFRLIPAELIHHLFYTVPFTDYEWYNPIYWTLAIEFQFYILIALIYPLLVSKNKAVKIAVLLVITAVQLVFNDNRFVFLYLPVFAMGITLFWYKTNQINWNLAAILFVVFSVFIYFSNGVEITITAVVTTCIIGLIDLNYRLFNKLGDISYSLYLTHGIIGGNIIYFLWDFAPTYGQKLLIIFGAIICSTIGAWVFWWLFEQPSKKWSKKVGKG